MSEELLPCPFCGNAPKYLEHPDNNGDRIICPLGHVRFRTVEGWNTRSSPWVPIRTAEDLPKDARESHLFRDAFGNSEVRAYVVESECDYAKLGGYIAWMPIPPYTPDSITEGGTFLGGRDVARI